MSNLAASELARADHWSTAFCKDYAPTALNLALLFLIVAGVAAVVVIVIEAVRLRAKPKADESGGGPGAAASAIAGLIEGLAKAPAWLALLGSGLFLFWMAGNAVPNFCLLPQDRPAPGKSEAEPDTAPRPLPAHSGESDRQADPPQPKAGADPEAGGGATG